MTTPKSKEIAPYVMDRYGIRNAHNGIWTPNTFDSLSEANAYIARYEDQNKNSDLSKHTVIRVRVTVEAIEPC